MSDGCDSFYGTPLTPLTLDQDDGDSQMIEAKAFMQRHLRSKGFSVNEYVCIFSEFALDILLSAKL